MTYVQLPRRAGYVNPRYLNQPSQQRFVADLNANFGAATQLPAVVNDEPLVRSFSQHFFSTETTYQPYVAYLNDVYVKHLFAETKIVNGLGDAEQWSALLPPEKFQALKQRVDIDFAHTNKKAFQADQPVRLDLYVKNVSTLIVKVFEINTSNYYRNQKREVNTDIGLDGLVPNQELTFSYDEPALRRMARHFEFPKLSGRGVYVIDFIGNGKSSRVVVRKGRLRHLVHTTPDGHVFTVLNEKNEKVEGAGLWMAGHQYQADDDGTITVPFSTQAQTQVIVLNSGSFSSLDQFTHQTENYQLTAGIFVDRESLLKRKKAQVVIRPQLQLNRIPVSVALLQNPRLVLTSTDHDGVSTNMEVTDFRLFEDRESVHEFQVPERLSQLSVRLQAQVKNQSQNKNIDVAVAESFVLNQIDPTDKFEDVHLHCHRGDYILDVLGKTGEARPHRPVRVSLKHRDFRDAVDVSLQSDENGRVQMGQLPGITSLTVAGPQGTNRTWQLHQDRHTFQQTVHASAGTPIELPFMEPGDNLDRRQVSLLELRQSKYVADRFSSLQRKNGMLIISDLAPGQYDLALKTTGETIRIVITSGVVLDDYVLGDFRQLEIRNPKPLQIARVAEEDEAVIVHLSNSNKFARVHVFATNYEPAYWAYDYLGSVRDANPIATTRPKQLSLYAAGRKIGDEYRYIIDRKYAKKFPGNMLTRPSLLLTPWALRQTETEEQELREGDDFAPEADMKAGGAARAGGLMRQQETTGDFANLDFLGEASTVHLNLIPDDQGIVSISRDQLGPHQRIWIVAVDPNDTACRRLSLQEPDVPFQDLRLADNLDPEKHFTQQKSVSVVKKGETFELADISAASFETYDSLTKVHSLLVTLSKNPTLTEFAFVLQWDQLSPEQKREKYSKYACHELSFFLARKDPEFFRQVVAPFLENKKDKTFLDQWLVGAPLDSYLDIWSYQQLNVAERILLAQRVRDESLRTSRWVRDQYDLIPPNIERYEFLFDTAVKDSGLEATDAYGLEEAKKSVQLGRGIGGRGGEDSKAIPRSLATRAARPSAAAETPPPAPAEEPTMKKEAEKESESLSGRRRKRDANADKDGVNSFYRLPQREAGRRLYVQMDKTQEWAENNYYHVPIDGQNADLIKVNAFWRDLAEHTPDKPFFSINFAEASNSFSEMMLVLSLLDLPLRSGEHETSFDDAKMTLKAGDDMVVFHREIRPAVALEEKIPILVSQNFFRQDDRYQFIDNERMDKFVSDEFLVQTAYGCQVVVTNPTSTPQKLDLLLQIPQGSLPIQNGHVTRSVHVDLQPFNTQTIEYLFYFPVSGEFDHYPIQVAKKGKLVASADPVVFNVVDRLTKIDRQSWAYVSQLGTDDDVLTFLEECNLQRIDLNKIAFRMKDPEFFQRAVRLLGANHVYNNTLWSYSVKHNVPELVRQFLAHNTGFVQQCGSFLKSPLLSIDPVARKTYQHLDYRPLVNARAHQLGAQRKILNQRQLQQYQRLLKILSYQRELDDDQLMAVTYYMLLQDRIEEALTLFARVRPDRLATRLQYDYFTAYLDFFSEDPKLAGPIVEQYADYPVDRWRNAFAVVGKQLKEVQGTAAEVIDEESREQTQTALAATEPSFEFTVESRQVKLSYQNLGRVRVNYYLMDIELLFSRNPFVQQYSDQFSFIQPNVSVDLDLPGDKDTTTLALPEQLQNSNVLVEIQGSGLTKTAAYYSNALSIQIVENYGQVQVKHQATGKPLAKVYVKVYARMQDGSVRFYKDGYTDLRGRFDYTSLNTNDLNFAKKFALLILSEDHGAVVREANPPKR